MGTLSDSLVETSFLRSLSIRASTTKNHKITKKFLNINKWITKFGSVLNGSNIDRIKVKINWGPNDKQQLNTRSLTTWNKSLLIPMTSSYLGNYSAEISGVRICLMMMRLRRSLVLTMTRKSISDNTSSWTQFLSKPQTYWPNAYSFSGKCMFVASLSSTQQMEILREWLPVKIYSNTWIFD